MFKIKKPLMAAAVSLALGMGMATSVQADPALFNTHDADGIIKIGGLDWGTTTFLAQGGQAAIGAFIGTGGACPAGSCVFNVMTQSSLGGFIDPNGDPLGVTGNNVRYQLTLVAKFQEAVVGVAGSTATFATVPTGPTIVEIYYDRLPAGGGAGTAAASLSGSGFNDGRLIFKAESVGDATGSFTVTDPAFVALDQNGTNQYPGQLTISGRGDNGVITVGDITTDPTYFLLSLAALGLDFGNISQSLPFSAVNPMDCFTETVANTTVGTSNAAYACDTAHAAGPYAVQTALVGGYVPFVGPVNGLFPLGFPDFVAQTDFNSALNAIPEPTSLALLGLGLGALGFGVSRRRRKAA